MAVSIIFPLQPDNAIPPLENGDHLTRIEFERRYEAMPHRKKAELIEGVVYLTPRVTFAHSKGQARLIGWLGYYHAYTAGVEAGAHATLRLDWDNEVRPAALLFVNSVHRG